MFVRDDIFEENGWNDVFFTRDSEGNYTDEEVTWDRVIDLVAKLQTKQLQF